MVFRTQAGQESLSWQMKRWNFHEFLGLIWPKVLGFDHFNPLAEPLGTCH